MSKREQHNDALLMISSQCPHCPAMLEHLAQMLKQGDIASFRAINIEHEPELAEAYGVRSVPWLKIGEHASTGAQSLAEMQQKARWLGDKKAVVAQIDQMLSHAKAPEVVELIADNPSLFEAVLELLADGDSALSTRIGIGVVMEEFATAAWMPLHYGRLIKLTNDRDRRIRSDVYYYLSLTGSTQALQVLEAIQHETDSENQAILQEAIDDLRETALNLPEHTPFASDS